MKDTTSTAGDGELVIERLLIFVFHFFRAFQDNFSVHIRWASQKVGQKLGNPQKNHLAYPQAQLGLSHMFECEARTHTRHNGEMIEKNFSAQSATQAT